MPSADNAQQRHGEASLACLDGQLMDSASASIPVIDEGLLRGDGVFEVVRLYDGQPFALQEHLDRMQRSAANLMLALDRSAVEADIASLLEATAPQDGLLRALVTRGGHRVVLIEPLPPLPQSVSLGHVSYCSTLVLDGVKSLSYAANMLAGRLARERGFDDALLVGSDGRVLECPTASFFWVRDGELLTPPLTDHVLDSITRRLIIAAAGARELSTSVAELAGAQEAFVASSVREVLPVHAIEDVALPVPGPITAATAQTVSARVQSAVKRSAAATSSA